MKKIPFLAFLFLIFCCSIYSQAQPRTASIDIDFKDTEQKEKLKHDIEEKLTKTKLVRFDFSPAKFHLAIAITSIDLKQNVLGYAVAYIITEGKECDDSIVFDVKDAGVLTVSSVSQIPDKVVPDFIKVLLTS